MHDVPICEDCKWGGGLLHPFCDAYPDGIPAEILWNEVDHRKPYEGDHGIQFEPKEEPPQDDGDEKDAGPEGPAPGQ